MRNVELVQMDRVQPPAWAPGVEAARDAGLVWVTDELPGIRRVKRGKGFAYVKPDGKPLRDAGELKRIRALVIPPAWTNVWICPLANGHIQAIGRDAKGRRQYRYHAKFRAVRDEDKFHRLLEFGRALPRIRRRIRRDLAKHALPREKVLATVVRLLEETLIRVGNEEYARANHSYGLTTLRDQHVRVKGGRIRFHFRGKSGKVHEMEVADPRLAHIVKRCQDLPGQELFQFVDAEGRRHTISSHDVNAYLREIAGAEFTAKDFRTWAGTVAAACLLRAAAPCLTQRATREQVSQCMKSVAERLGNTPAVCRKSYVHPAVLDAFSRGELARLAGTRPGEALVLRLLRAQRRAGRGCGDL